MKTYIIRVFQCVSLVSVLVFASIVSAETGPVNLAPSATASSSSEYDDNYAARLAVDGIIAGAGSGADLGRAWCVRGDTAKGKGEFSLKWNEPVDVAEIVYFGRTAFFMSECWKHYQVFLDDQTEPIATGVFEQKHGPQQITIPQRKVRQIRLAFLDSYGGPNPGAAEIMVFAEPLSKKELRNLGADSTPEPITEIDPQDRQTLLHGLDRFVVIKRFEIEASHVYTYHYEAFRAGGGLYVYDTKKLLDNANDAATLLVDTPQGQILDADISYDGKTILFSWRQKQSAPYHLWSINVDGTDLKQLTDGPWHDYNACWLPDGDIAFLSSRSPQFAYCWNAPVGILHRMRPDGSRLIRLSDNYLNDFTPTVLDDGRIIYGRWEYVDRPAIPIQSLWTIHPDGTDLQVFYGNRVLSPATFMEAKQIPGTTQVVCTMTGHNGPTRGAIGILERGYGVNEQKSIQNITPDIPVDRVDHGDGNYWPIQIYSGPYPLDAKRFLVSARGPLLVRTFELNSETNRPQLEATLLERPDDGMQFLNAIPVRSRQQPPVLYSDILHGDDGSNRPTHATLVLQDVYEGLGPDVKRGDVAAVRIVREMQKTVRIEPHLRAFGFQFPVISCGATYAGKMVLGDVPVAEDGSAHFNIGLGATRGAAGYGSEILRQESMDVPELAPTTGPIYFLALDKEGRAIQRMRSFTHLMPGEKQSCVGCHDSRTSTPLRLGNFAVSATREPVDPTLPDWADAERLFPDRAAFSPGFDYVRLVQPVWDRYCTDCHNSHETGGGIDLSGEYTDYFNVSYETLVSEKQGPNGSPHVSWIPTYNGHEQNILKIEPKQWGSYASPLVELIRSGHPDENGEKRIEMDDESRRKVYAWIDLNIPYYASSETSDPDALGCRRIYPKNLDVVLNEVGNRRCAECHEKGNIQRREWTWRTQNQFQFPQENADGVVPRRPWVRITEPQLNPFLLAPLAKSAGGTEQCGKAIFVDKSDPDYVKILETFSAIQEEIKTRPRIDMPGGAPAPDVCRLTD